MTICCAVLFAVLFFFFAALLGKFAELMVTYNVFRIFIAVFMIIPAALVVGSWYRKR